MKPLIAVVTGANRGIGLEIARQLAARDCTVVLTARREDAAGSAAASLRNTRVVPWSVDVTDEASVERLAEFLRERFGYCDVLINNAGILADGDDAITSVSPATVRATLETNTIAPLRVAQALLPLLRQSERGGRIINVSSGAGELTDFDGSWAPAYSLSKAALNLVTRMLAPACKNDRVAVNSMCPGWVRTDMGGANAPREVSQGADTAVWLALDAPADTTGGFYRDRAPIPW